jgi:hypothetical protein
MPACLQDENFPASLGNDHSAAALHCKMLLMDLLRDVRKYLVAHRSVAGMRSSSAVQCCGHLYAAVHTVAVARACLQEIQHGWLAAAAEAVAAAASANSHAHVANVLRCCATSVLPAAHWFGSVLRNGCDSLVSTRRCTRAMGAGTTLSQAPVLFCAGCSPYKSYAEQRLAAKHNPYVNMLLAGEAAAQQPAAPHAMYMAREYAAC